VTNFSESTLNSPLGGSGDDERIAIFMPSIELGGQSRAAINLLTKLSEKSYGLQLDLLVIDVDPDLGVQIPKSVNVHYIGREIPIPGASRFLSTRMRRSLGSVKGLVSYLREYRPTALISFQSSVIAVIASRLARTTTRMIVRESNHPTEAVKELGWFRAQLGLWAKRIAYKRADAIVAISQGASENLKQALHLPADLVNVIYNPTSRPELRELSLESTGVEFLDASDHVPAIVYVGRFAHQKDVPTLVRAFGIVRQQIECRLVLVGDGEKRSEIEDLVSELGLSADVDFVGFRYNPYPFMARASVFTVTSIYEGNPNALIEALTCGAPSISTDCPSGPREVLMDGAGGELVPMGDHGALAESMMRYLRDPEYAAGLLELAKANLHRFYPETAAERYLKLVRGAELDPL
jgi:glycosyltransferase involved in cell wall biosynthesis